MNELLTTQLEEKTIQLDTNEKEIEHLRCELQACEAGRVHVERQQAEFNAFNGLDSVSILYCVVNCN